MTEHADADGDGFCMAPAGLWDAKAHLCLADGGFGDCDDQSADVSPLAEEICLDGVDNNCNGEVDEVVQVDADGDGALSSTCEAFDDDCDDSDPERFPGAVERCDGVDNDCDGAVDDGLELLPLYLDRDGDGAGRNAPSELESCRLVDGYAQVSGDCDDDDPSIGPRQDERCNLIDDDCDGQIDEGGPRTDFYEDLDGDGYGNEEGSTIFGCAEALQPGWARRTGDCDDTDRFVRPEILDDTCDGVDNNCNQSVDEDAGIRDWFVDSDADGWGSGEPSEACEALAPAGSASRDGDCDDSDPTSHPGVNPDLCNGVDNDCDGDIDEDAPTYSYFPDDDNDGYASGVPEETCVQPVPVAAAGGDCDDSDADVNPAAVDVPCDGLDQDCDGDARCRTDVFWVTGSRSTGMLAGGSELPLSQATCSTSTRTWMADRVGFEGEDDFGDTITLRSGTRLHMAWSALDHDSLAIPALGLTDLEPEGSVDVEVPTSNVVLQLMAETEVLGEITVEVVPHSPPPAGLSACHLVPHPEGYIPVRPILDNPAMPTPVGSCEVDPLNATSVFDPDGCCDQIDPDGTSAPWEVSGNSETNLTFTAGEVGLGNVFRAYGYPTVLDPRSPLSLSWLVSSFDGGLWYRVGLIWEEPTDDVCALGSQPSSASPWFLDSQIQHWDFGPGQVLSTGPFPVQNVGSVTQGVRVIPYVEVYLPSPIDSSAELELQQLELFCCGPHCGTCIDYDNDNRGPWCGTGTALSWDCDDADGMVYPGLPALPPNQCDNRSWWALTCSTP